MRPIEASPDKLYIAVPNRFYKDWVETYYVPVLMESAAAVTGRTPEVHIEIGAPGQVADDREESAASPAPAEKPSRPAAFSANGAPYELTSEYTFDNFIVGPANRLCHAAAMAVVDAPGKAYNPLFIHGGVGLGKTHLLQAASGAFLAKNPTSRLVYTSCEEFVNDFVSALQRGDIGTFRQRLRDVDFIVIDDIHFLARAERTQEEFFHTFNSLYNAHKQIVLSSDSAPADIPSLEDRLVSRFKWGLIARLDPPAYETRLAIVNRKADHRGISLPKDVGEYIARSIDTNIRELEGALTRVLGFAALTNSPLTLQAAEEALRDVMLRRPTVNIEEIAKVVAGRYGVKLADLQGKRRLKSIALPRQVCMHIARRLTDYSLEEIGGFFGGRDHTTVLYAEAKVEGLLKTDPQMRRVVSDIEGELLRGKR